MRYVVPAISEILAVIIILGVSGVVGSILYLNYSENAADSIDIISDRNSLAMKKATELVDISFPTSFPGKVEFLIHNYSPKDVLNKDEFAVYIMDDMGNVRNGDLEKLEFYKKSGDDRRDMDRVESGNFAQASYLGIDCPEESLILVTPAKEIIEIPTEEPCACPTGERPASDGTICVPLEWDVDDILCEEVRGDRIVDKCVGFGQSTCDLDPDGDGVGECVCKSTDSSVLNQDTCECVIDGATWNDDLNTCECRADKVVKNGACACPDGEVLCSDGACRNKEQCKVFGAVPPPECTSDSDCDVYEVCENRACVVPAACTQEQLDAGMVEKDSHRGKRCTCDVLFRVWDANTKACVCDGIFVEDANTKACRCPDGYKQDTLPACVCPDGYSGGGGTAACHPYEGTGNCPGTPCPTHFWCDESIGVCVNDVSPPQEHCPIVGKIVNTAETTCVDCNSDSDCSGSDQCVSGTCKAAPTCNPDPTLCQIVDPTDSTVCISECGADETCENGACKAAGLDCDANACEGPNDDSTACEYKCKAPNTSCIAGECGAPIRGTSLKCTEKTSQENKFTCWRESVYGFCSNACLSDQVCINDECVCQPGSCLKNDGRGGCVSACKSNERCDGSDNCIEITCDANECQELNRWKDACISTCSGGKTCDGNGNCITGTRAPAPTTCLEGCHTYDGSRCVYECRSGFTCRNDECVRSSCTGGRVMVNGQCEIRASCSGCYGYSRASNDCYYRCAGNESCTNGRCVTSSCFGDNVLVGGRCVERANCDSNKCQTWQVGNTCNNWCADSGGTCTGGSCKTSSGTPEPVVPTCESSQCLKLNADSTACVDKCTNAHQSCNGSGSCVYTSCPGNQILIGTSCQTPKDCSSSCQTLDRSTNTCTGGCNSHQSCQSGTCVQTSCPGSLLLIDGRCVARASCSSCQTLDTSTNRCENNCRSDQTCSGGTCKCQSGKEEVGGQCVKSCGTHEKRVGTSCVRCPGHQTANSAHTSCVPVTCSGHGSSGNHGHNIIENNQCRHCSAYGTIKSGNTCVAVGCGFGQALGHHGCKDCADNQRGIGLVCVTFTCPVGQYAENHQCVSCQPGERTNGCRGIL